MTRRFSPGAGACILIAGFGSFALATSPQLGQANEQGLASSLPISCSVDRPVVEEGGSVLLRAWARSEKDETLEYVWTTAAGKVGGAGHEVRWDLAGVAPAPQPIEADVRVKTGSAVASTCSVQIIVEKKSQPIARGQETGRSFLVKGNNEEKKFGLYSYLLLGAPPTNSNRERYVKTIEAFMARIVEISALEDYIPRSKLNVTYLPVLDAPTSKPSADWILEHYDYARARAVLGVLNTNLREGPYFISVLTPLGTGGTPSQYLLQDLSGVPTTGELISWWIREFLNQAAQERFWEPRTASSLVLKLRTAIAVLAVGLPDVRKGVETWISWIH